MFSFKALAVALAAAIGSTSWAMESPDASDDVGRVELLAAWWFPDESADLLFTWSRPDPRKELVWWQAARGSALLFAFSSPEENGDLAFAWSRPDPSRQLLFTWSQALEPATEGSGGGEPLEPATEGSGSGEPDAQ